MYLPIRSLSGWTSIPQCEYTWSEEWKVLFFPIHRWPKAAIPRPRSPKAPCILPWWKMRGWPDGPRKDLCWKQGRFLSILYIQLCRIFRVADWFRYKGCDWVLKEVKFTPKKWVRPRFSEMPLGASEHGPEIQSFPC